MRILIAVFALVCTGSTVAVAGDLAAGEVVFKKICGGCHLIGVLGATPREMHGPPLNGVVGREWGAVKSFKYSQGKEGTLLAMHAAQAKTWDVQTLTAYLHRPKGVIPKGKMVLVRVLKDEDIENVIFYLAQFDGDGNKVDPAAVLSDLGKSVAEPLTQPETGSGIVTIPAPKDVVPQR